MTWVEWFSVLTAAGGVVASILGAWLIYAARTNGQATRELIREMQAETRALLGRMDQRADERQRESLDAMAPLSAL